ncbi:MAG: hypothetical protein LBS34_01395 [Rickettsiales bacterium]|jgi:hypothetical protein|nr:hypothetical protein [Rickettsiales bacterium]
MELKEFVKTTIEQILEGVSEVKHNKNYKVGVQYCSTVHSIDFEVMLTTQKGKENGIAVYLPNIGVGTKTKSENVSLSKVTFQIPIIWELKT